MKMPKEVNPLKVPSLARSVSKPLKVLLVPAIDLLPSWSSIAEVRGTTLLKLIVDSGVYVGTTLLKLIVDSGVYVGTTLLKLIMSEVKSEKK